MLPSTRPAKILIVDDTQENANILARLVERTMHQKATVAYNGTEALQFLAAEDFDLVILDILMPDINGLEVLKRIRTEHDLQSLPVILISAKSSNQDITEGLAMGANDYITKPLTLSIIRVRIETQLQLKRLTDERQKLLNTLQYANASKNRLMRIASHDLKNPLHSLGMILSLLETEVVENTKYLDSAFRHVATMESIISEFLELDILRDEKIQIEKQVLSAREIIEDVLKEYRTLAARKEVEVVTDLQADFVMADAKRLKQVISNLVSNAVKYAPKGTTVTITTEVTDNTFVLHVIDQGEGIPADEVDKLFQPFGKLSTQPTAGEHSTGLGLWIVHQMMEALDGEVRLNMDYTDGADFRITIPLDFSDLDS